MQVLLLWGLGVWVIWADPFGLSSASEHALAEDVSRLRAHAQPVAPAPITVVNIDYDSIQKLHDAHRLDADDWPLTYGDHVRILSRLISRLDEDGGPGEADVPAAVFYDVFFERPRAASGDMQRLGRMLDRIGRNVDGRHYPPVYLAGGGGKVPMSDESYALLHKPKLVAAAWDGLGDDYPLSHELHDPGHETIVPDTAPSAAWVLYQALCRARSDCHDIQPQDVLSPQWVLRGDKAPCGDWADRVPGYVARTLSRYLGFSSAPVSASTDCLPVHQVSLSTLFQPGGGHLRPPYLAPGEPFVVLAGVIMPSLNDYHATPLYQRLAGVYIHAMALENLNRLGGDFLRARNIRYVSLLAWLVLTVLVCGWREFLQDRVVRGICRRCGWRNQSRRPSEWGVARRAARRVRQRGAILVGRILRALAIPAVMRSAARRGAARLARRVVWLLIWIAMVLFIYWLCYAVLDIALQGWLFMIGLVSLLLFWDGSPPAERQS